MSRKILPLKAKMSTFQVVVITVIVRRNLFDPREPQENTIEKMWLTPLHPNVTHLHYVHYHQYLRCGVHQA